MERRGRSWGDTPPQEPRPTERGLLTLRRVVAVAGLVGILGVSGMTGAGAASASASTDPGTGGQHQPTGRAWS